MVYVLFFQELFSNSYASLVEDKISEQQKGSSLPTTRDLSFMNLICAWRHRFSSRRASTVAYGGKFLYLILCDRRAPAELF